MIFTKRYEKVLPALCACVPSSSQYTMGWLPTVPVYPRFGALEIILRNVATLKLGHRHFKQAARLYSTGTIVETHQVLLI